MATLTKAEILEFDDRPTLELLMPEWGGRSVLIRSLSSTQIDSFEAGIMDKNGKPTRLQNLRARFATMVLVNDAGEPLFREQQVVQLGNKSARALTRIWEAGRKFNKMDDDAVESAEKNSEAAQSGSSGSSSPSPSDTQESENSSD